MRDDVEALAAEVRRHRELYYNGSPELDDAAFDALEDRLRALAPEHPALAEVGAPPPTSNEEDGGGQSPAAAPGADPESLAAKVVEMSERAYTDGPNMDPAAYKALFLSLRAAAPDHPALRDVVPARGLEWPKSPHEIPMGSLNKVNTAAELHEWAERCDALAAKSEMDTISSDLSVTEKLDGISIELLYDGGRFETAITRGDGQIGERIGPNVRRVAGVPATIPHAGRVSVRGEIIMRKSRADAFMVFKKTLDDEFERLKSLRNTASGIARTKDLRYLPACAFLDALFYDVEGFEWLSTEAEKLEWIERMGFGTPAHDHGPIERVLEIHQAYQDELRTKLDYEIDGLVVRANQLAPQTLLGELNRRPRAAVAFKFENDAQVTILRSVEWSTGDSGRVTPVAQVDPVFLAGAEVRQASLHNLARVQALNVGAEDRVLVSRRGDVIPYVESVVVDGGAQAEAPERCGVCAHELARDGEYLVCPNEACPARMRGRVKVWIKQLGLLEWGEKTVETLYEVGLLREPADLYRLRLSDVTALKGYGETTAEKLLTPLEDAKQIPLPTFIAALAIPSVSKETGRLLVNAGFSTLEALFEATEEELAAVDGLGEIKARKIKDGLESRREEISRLADVGVEPIAPDASGPLAGLSFCFSGSLWKPRKELALLVESQGGTVASGVSKGLSYLVLADANSTSAKAEKARKYGTEILDEDGFKRVIASASGSV